MFGSKGVSIDGAEAGVVVVESEEGICVSSSSSQIFSHAVLDGVDPASPSPDDAVTICAPLPFLSRISKNARRILTSCRLDGWGLEVSEIFDESVLRLSRVESVISRVQSIRFALLKSNCQRLRLHNHTSRSGE